ncbi:MAG: zinc metallopeptidase [Deltaproteobacteria bacterium]|nr:zinc metallopeptidase [Deltaproteobacteria bacterium]
MPFFVPLWWPLCAVLLVRIASLPLASTWYRRTRDRHDWANPDVLPQTAREWLRDRAAALGVEIVVTDDRAKTSQNAFYPRTHTIQLTAEVAYKADPTAWAVAAHELGHAQFRRRYPGVVAVLFATQVPRLALVRVGAALALGNALFGLPGVTTVALAVLVLHAVLGWYPLVEEAYASAWAYRALRDEPAITPAHRRAIRATLAGAFGTYLLPRVAIAIALSQWWIVRAITGDGRLGELAALTGLGRAVMIAATAMAALAAALALSPRLDRALGRRIDVERHALPLLGVKLAWIVMQLAVIALVWDLRGDAAWAWCVMLALAPVVPQALSLVLAPTLLALTPVLLLGRRALVALAGPGLEHSAAYAAARARGEVELLAGNAAIGRIALRNPRAVTRAERALALHALAFVPLYVAYWLT